MILIVSPIPTTGFASHLGTTESGYETGTSMMPVLVFGVGPLGIMGSHPDSLLALLICL
jgi:hypothetical protein